MHRAFLANKPICPTINGLAFWAINACTLSHNSLSIIGSCVPSTLYHWSLGLGLFCLVLYEILPYFPWTILPIYISLMSISDIAKYFHKVLFWVLGCLYRKSWSRLYSVGLGIALSFNIRAIAVFPYPCENNVKTSLTTLAASSSIIKCPFWSGSFLYPYKANAPIWYPFFLLSVRTLFIFSDISSKYHSFTRPLICLDFLFPLLAVSALSTILINRIPQTGKRPWIYFSTNSSSLVNLDCVLQRTISNLWFSASFNSRLNSGRRLSEPV